MKQSIWRWVLLLGGASVLAGLAWKLGVGPFVDGFTRVDGAALAGASVITFVTTVCCAWRWRLVARGIGVDLPLRSAVAAYYRSQFVNSVLPGGVLGDVHRGVDQGLKSGDVARALRAVAWERIGGQVVQVLLAVALLSSVPSPVRSFMPVVAVGLVLVLFGAVVAVRVLLTGGSSVPARAIRASASDVRRGLLSGNSWPGVVLASGLAVTGHTVVFLIAARAAGVTVSPVRMLPLAVLVLLAMSVPTNIAGWGPREGAAAWAFTAAGLGASQGVTVAVVYGVLAFVAGLPGAVILVLGWLRHRRGVRSTGSVRDSHPSAGVRREPSACLNVRTPCSAAACRSTDISMMPASVDYCSRTPPTSTGSTRCAPRAMRF